jgi:hypothetical protein
MSEGEILYVPPGTLRWVRVSRRGRWHWVILQLDETSSWETACGRMYPLWKPGTVAAGERPGDVCDKCYEKYRRSHRGKSP